MIGVTNLVAPIYFLSILITNYMNYNKYKNAYLYIFMKFSYLIYK